MPIITNEGTQQDSKIDKLCCYTSRYTTAHQQIICTYGCSSKTAGRVTHHKMMIHEFIFLVEMDEDLEAEVFTLES